MHSRHTLVLLSLLPLRLLAQVDYARDLVDPFVGTGGHGHTFPGACVPNGLVQLSPDTRMDGYMDWDACGGYHYSDSVIHGFSHTHLSGTGVPDLCDVLLMPVTGGQDVFNYAQRFDHAHEQANAGYYKVLLNGPAVIPARTSAAPAEVHASPITVELTATARVGVHRYMFPADQEAHVVLDLRPRDKLLASSITIVSPTEVVGERRSSSWARDQHLFYCIRFSAPMSPDVSADLLLNKAQGFQFGKLKAPLIVKVGISAVSIEGARANLEAEVPGWDFDAVRRQAEDAWNTKLSKIEVEGGTREQQRTFYTALYHCYVVPYVFNDANGDYRGMDGQVHHADHNVYTVFSLWDTFRALHPLMTILEPDMTNDFIRTFLLNYQEGGRLPVWELWGNETDCMIGYHSVSVIADAYLKGIRGFDLDLARKAMRASALRDDGSGLAQLRSQGFIASSDAPESVSRTLEYAYDNACMMPLLDPADPSTAQIRRLGESWKDLYDPATGFFRARYNGGFKQPFDPYEVNFNFTEANAWQYSLFVPQAMDGLIDAHGGEAAFELFLDRLFAAREATSGRDQSDITGLIGQYAHGNEPSHHMAYLYDRVGRPEKTRVLVKRIMDDFYHDAPDGLIGNEDCGQMSAWYVMSALGLYQIAPGIEASYDLGYPLFDKATVHLPNGHTWVMAVDPKAVAGAPRKFQLAHADLFAGGQLVFDAERRPVLPELPVSAEMDSPYAPAYLPDAAPVIEASAASFRDTLQVRVRGKGKCIVQYQSTSVPCPMDTPFVLNATGTVRVHWNADFQPVDAHFVKREGNATLKLDTRYADQYAAGGNDALIDGLRGGNDFRTGEWQGFDSADVVATIDLGGLKRLDRVGLSVIQDVGAWIWYPSSLTVVWSMNGHDWSSTTVDNAVPRDAHGIQHQELWTKALNGKKARYVKLIAHNAGPCPPWHPGHGGNSWIFADEILIEAH